MQSEQINKRERSKGFGGNRGERKAFLVCWEFQPEFLL